MNIRNAGEYIETFLKIKTKSGEIKPFRLNAAQKRLYQTIRAQHHAGKPIRIIILKARQLGFSTLTQGLIFADTATRENVRSLVVAHREDATSNLFRMSRLFLAELPELVTPMVRNSNAQELIFDSPARGADKRPGLRSSIRCVTAGGGGIGRSDTLTNVHLSEFAFWPGDKAQTLGGILQAVPSAPGTMVIIESTANGYEEFKRLWDAACAGQNDFVPVFFGWNENPEYRMEVPPGTEWTETERTLQARYDLTEQQLQWRRWCIRNNCAGDEDLFRQEYPISPEEAFLTSGSPVFDNAKILQQLESAPKPIAEGTFEFDYDGVTIRNARFNQAPNGFIKLYAMPEEGVPYVLGGDTAGDGSDWFTGHVIDNVTGNQVAVLRQQFDETAYARQMYCLGMFFNTALLGIENNYSTYPTKELERLQYPRLYVRQTEDTYTHTYKKSYGFLTTSVTRPVILANLVRVMLETPEKVLDRQTLEEMLVFAYNAHRRPEALPGEHDDLVMGLAITHYIREQQSFVRTEEKQAAVWTKDQWEDFHAANADEKKMLLKKWGQPH